MARDYVFQKEAYEDQIMHAAELIKNADAVIIGAGAVRGCNCPHCL